jgi:hypothetical protein
MVTMEFDASNLLNNLASDEAAFQEVPVRLRIGQLELLHLPNRVEGTEPGLPLSILDVARIDLASLKFAKQMGEYVYELDEYGNALLFRIVGDDVLVHSTITETTIKVSYERLLETWQAFASEVRAFASKEFPQLQERTGWAQWLAGEEDAPSEQFFPLWRTWFEDHEHCFEQIHAYEE